MRKKLIVSFLAVLLFGSLLAATAYAENAVVTGENVNLRSGPGVDYRVITTVPQGASVTIADRSNPNWYAVTYNGSYGFMSGNLLTVAESNTAVTIIAASGSGRINAMYVRFRSGPSSDSSVLGEYNQGKELTITGTAGDWVECTIDGRRGFVHSDYIDEETDDDTLTADAPQQSTSGKKTTPAKDDSVYPDAPAATPKPTAKPAATPKPTATPAPTAKPTAKPAASAAGNQSGYVDGDYVCFRSGPSTSNTIINTYNRGKELIITGLSGDWSAVNIDGQSGYIYSQYVKAVNSTQKTASASAPAAAATPKPTATPAPTKGTAGYITGNHVRFRSEASMTSRILGELFYGNEVTITGTTGDWTAITYDGQAGYVFSTYVAKGSMKAETAATAVPVGVKITGREVADFALQYVGYNYRWGGASPSTGFDCSGFTSYVYKQFGYELNRVACDQAKNGKHVDNNKLKPGDILCFYSGGSYIGHVGIYIGDNMFVHAANSSSGVITSSLTGYYATRGYEARRIL